jgi:hypothetical protein
MVEGYCYCIVVALTMCSGAANNRTTLVKKSGSYRPRIPPINNRKLHDNRQCVPNDLK